MVVDVKRKSQSRRKASKLGLVKPDYKKNKNPTGGSGGVDQKVNTPKNAKPEANKNGDSKVQRKRKSQEQNTDESGVAKKPKVVKKELKAERKIKKNDKDSFELKKKLKVLFEEFRRGDCKQEQKDVLCKQVATLMKGHMKEIIFAHDTVRIVESLLKLSDRALWDHLYEEVKDDLVTLMKMEYARFFVIKLLKYGSKVHRRDVFNVMHGHIVDLTSHAKAGSVVESMFNEYANGFERKKMCMEFYGALFTISKDTDVLPLDQILEKDPVQKDSILSQLKQTITKLIDKPAFCFSIIHRILLEYLKHCSPKDRTEMIESIRDSIIKILHTKDGANIGMICIWHGTAKDRKVIIQSFKTHISKICQEEHGCRILYAIFDHVDDTKFVGKVVIEEMMKTLGEWIFSLGGRRLMLYLLSPRNPKYFHPDVKAIFERGDNNATSKKDKDIRHQEFMKVVSEPLLAFASQNAEKLMNDNALFFVLQEIIFNCLGDKAELYQDLAKLAFKPVDMPDKENPHFIEQMTVKAIFKKLFDLDKLNHSKVDNKESLFCDALLRCVPEESIQSWIHCNRGCFVLLMMLETEIEHVVDKIKSLLKPVMKMIASKTFVGANLLQARLKKIQ